MLDAAKQTAEHQTPYLRNRDVQWDSISTDDLPTMDVLPSEIDRYTVADGDLLVCEGGDVGRAAIWSGRSRTLAYQKALHRLRPLSDGHESVRYMYYQLIAAKASGQFDSDDSKTTIAHLPADDFREMRFVFPSREHQAAVSSFLDAQTRRIDALIAKQKQLIELLKEKRQAVISQAVTKGVDPNVPMKSSGVGWLGEVPAHWEVAPMKMLASVQTGIAKGKAVEPEHRSLVPYLRALARTTASERHPAARGLMV